MNDFKHQVALIAPLAAFIIAGYVWMIIDILSN
jgi:hypothetical protein